MRKSFTMVEIIFVIVVLAIIAGGTFEFILKIYQSYARAKTVDTVQTELDLALTGLSNRLAYRIKDSVIYGGSATKLTSTTPIQENILEWISYDREGLMGMWDSTKSAVVPGWSGFSERNLMPNDGSQLISLGSNLNFANQIIESLSNGKVSLDTDDISKNRVALIIPSDDTTMRYGWYNQAGNNAFIVRCSNGNCNDENNFTYVTTGIYRDTESSFTFADRNDTDRYYLAWSAYALVLDTNTKELKLYYNYQPWADSDPDEYTDTAPNNPSNSILLRNVNKFQFKQQGNTIWLKICMDSGEEDTVSLDDTNSYGFCKERIVY